MTKERELKPGDIVKVIADHSHTGEGQNNINKFFEVYSVDDNSMNDTVNAPPEFNIICFPKRDDMDYTGRPILCCEDELKLVTPEP